MLRSARFNTTLAGIALLSALLGATSVSAAATKPAVKFPADQVAHPSVENEWWYIVGHVNSGKKQFGFEVDLMRTKTDNYQSDIAISDVSGQRFLQKLTPLKADDAVASQKKFALRYGDNTASGPPNNLKVHASLPGGKIDLTLKKDGPVMYVGGTGLIPFGVGSSYYYSLPYIKATGTIQIGKKSYKVDGVSWMDHQWGNWEWSAIKGWVWMGVQLDNGTAINLADFGGVGGSVAGGTAIDRDGKQEEITSMKVTAQDSWIYPGGDRNYPTKWLVSIPGDNSELTVTAQIQNQVLHPTSSASSAKMIPGTHASMLQQYYEGTSTVSGTWKGKPTKGKAYLEQTGP